MAQLNFQVHSRSFAHLTYIYPVVSRRSQGLSLGVNLNVNNACNWRCVYCQVEGLVRGKPDEIDLAKLEDELDYMLNWIINGDFMLHYAPLELQRFNDISLSGNGESTLSKQFLSVMQIIDKLRAKYGLAKKVKTVLITNGSEIDREDIQKALSLLQINNGEIWFKIDRATEKGISQVNQVAISLDGIIKRLKLAATKCNTYIQSCFFQVNQLNPSTAEIEEYINLIVQVKDLIAGVLIYSTARNPALPEGANISQVSEKFLAKVAQKLIKHGIKAKYYV